ncbi:hypothetical protein METHP14_190039 [Pseudomonas sp. P14-2025]
MKCSTADCSKRHKKAPARMSRGFLLGLGNVSGLQGVGQGACGAYQIERRAGGARFTRPRKT